MYSIILTTRFKKDVKRARGFVLFPFDELNIVLQYLRKGEKIPAKFKDHQLTGELKAFRECHLLYDFMLMYQINHQEKTVYLARVGSHAQLF
jgi:mRNA interferase YafQ